MPRTGARETLVTQAIREKENTFYYTLNGKHKKWADRYVNGLVRFIAGILRHKMVFTVDDVMEKIGSFERYQYRMLFIFGFMKIFGDGFQAMIPTFLSTEPPWRCKDNSSVCNFTGIFKPGDDNYKFRCSIPHDQWEFDTNELNSVVTEVG